MTARQTKIRESMDKVIATHNFSIASRYPSDLECDDKVIQHFGTGPAQLGWVVGDTHTHIVALGIHPELNEMVQCYLSIGSTDKFFKLTLIGSEDFKLTEVDKATFASLAHTKIPYSKAGSDDRHGLVLLKNGTPIVDIRFSRTGSVGELVHHVKLRALTTINDLDRYAAEAWANLTLCKVISSIFFRSDVQWEDDEATGPSAISTANKGLLSLF